MQGMKPIVEDEADLPPSSAEGLVKSAWTAVGLLGALVGACLVAAMMNRSAEILVVSWPFIVLSVIGAGYAWVVSRMVELQRDLRALALVLGLVLVGTFVTMIILAIRRASVTSQGLAFFVLPLCLVVGVGYFLFMLVPLASRDLAAWLHRAKSQGPDGRTPLPTAPLGDVKPAVRERRTLRAPRGIKRIG